MNSEKFNGYDRPPYYEDDSVEVVNCDFCDDKQEITELYGGEGGENLCGKCYAEYRMWYSTNIENDSVEDIDKTYNEMKDRLFSAKINGGQK